MQDSASPKWIWCGDAQQDENIWAWALREFDFSGGAHAQCYLHICADLRYTLWLNGLRIGFGPPKFHAQTPTYDTYEITRFLKGGRNLLAIHVYSFGNRKISSCMPRNGRLWARLIFPFEEIVTDRRWKMRRDPAYAIHTVDRYTFQPPCEAYDARLRIFSPENTCQSFDDWPQARELALAPLRMEVRDIPFMESLRAKPDRIIESGFASFSRSYAEIPMSQMAGEIASAETVPDRYGAISRSDNIVAFDGANLSRKQSFYALFDLGRLWTGYPVFRMSGPAGSIIDVSYSEDLFLHRIRPDKLPELPYFDRVVLGDAEIEHRITWPKCARYVQINAHGNGAIHCEVIWERSSYPVQWRGFFGSDRPVYNQAWEISAHTVQLCMEDSFMDTPWRERGSWLGDDLIKARVSYSVFGDYALARRFLLHHARGQKSDGSLCGKYPGNVTSHVSTWTLCYPLSVAEYCAESGDRAFACQVRVALEGIVSWLEALRHDDDLFYAPPAEVTAHVNRYNFIDWAPIDMRGANAAWNAFAYACLEAVSKLADWAGDASLKNRADEMACALKRAFQRRFWDEERGVFCNGVFDGKRLSRWGAQENCLALVFGLAAPWQAEALIQELVSRATGSFFIPEEGDYDVIDPECGKSPGVAIALSRYRWPDEKMVPVGTAYFAEYLLRALLEAGRVVEAQDFIEERWGEFSRQGATSVWETWSPKNSLSHGWSGAPAALAGRYFLGVHRAEEGDGYNVLPLAGRFTQVRGRVTTRFGEVDVAWARLPQWSLVVDLPPGAVFEVGLPLIEGQCLLVDGRPAERVRPIIRGGQQFFAIKLGAGRHHLDVTK